MNSIQLPSRIGRYEIRGIAGRGAMAVVYDAYDPDNNRRAAVKVFRPEADLTESQVNELLARFEAEASAAKSIANRHVIEIYEAGRDGDRHFIAMEFIEGSNLKELLELGTSFSLSDVSDIALQVADGLDAIHRLGIVHRDIKPANIVRTAEGRIFITDFGIVKLSEDATFSQEGSIVGTPNYMSPEQIQGSHKAKVDHRSDIFSLGVVCYELLTRRKPFEGKDITQTMYNITHVHPASPLIYNPELPQRLENVLFRALAKNADDRFQRAKDFAVELARVEQEEHLKNVTFGGAQARRPASVAGKTAAVGADDMPLYLKREQGVAQLTGYPRTRAAIDPGRPVYCADCGMENAAEETYCVRCGMRLLKRTEFVDELKRAGRIAPHPLIPLYYIIVNALAVGVLVLLVWLLLKSG
ncbi:MAG: protein kinase [bacterium]